MQINKYNQDGEYEDTIEENMFGECESVVSYLKDERVCDILYIEKSKRFLLVEQCDEWYGVELTPEICRSLSELLLKIADTVEKSAAE